MNTLTHDTLLFNVHDLILLMAVGQYLLLAVLLQFTRRSADYSTYLLISILLVTAIQALDTLVTWSDPLRHLLLDWHPSLLFLGSFSYWLLGPLLYWYVASVLYRGFHFRPLDLLHLVPTLLVGILLIWNYYRLPTTEQINLMWDMSFMWSPLMSRLVSGWHISVIAYGCWCLVLLWRYHRELHQVYANVEQRERMWLVWIVAGFVLIAAWRLLVHVIGDALSAGISNAMGIVSNYIMFLFVNSLVFISIRYTHLFGGLNSLKGESDATAEFTPEQIQRVERLMQTERAYLEPDVTIESLAKRLSLPERTLSRILNQHFGKNFFEFINSYRVEDAKRLLTDPDYQTWTMLEVLAEAGFTSKSTFNAIFKKQVGQTPSQYRQNAMKNPTPADF
ncbi:AraC family transcriptional regulator [Marinimicrobium sp. ABcell2]|uniref:helix-turn-helix domain-containing protein n=1 Tax=Marinimicrobium sp. ABcell2 TaxID=3069751 RepID=UPI0027AF89AC|nr:helix-turn-helix domain-containing protein [Marinimicrobium sp. ABcell2]MDQ2077049.1 helix-turn-helix domain-containing protein [Marinimicrobium sp. ABcell2]